MSGIAFAFKDQIVFYMSRFIIRFIVLSFLSLNIVSFTFDKREKKKSPKKMATKKVAKVKLVEVITTADTGYNSYYIIVDKSDYELKVYD